MKTRFSYTLDDLKQLARDVLQQANLTGASAAEVEVSLGFGQNISVRLSEVETIEYNRDKGMSITVFFGQRRGHASTSDLSAQALRDTVSAACSIARYTAQDPFCGLADPHLLAQEIPDLKLYHPWEVTVEQAITLAMECESAAFAVDNRIRNSEGANVSAHESMFAYANSNGFCQGYPSSQHAMSCSAIANEGDNMQRDYWYSTARSVANMETAGEVGRKAGLRSVRRLNARKLSTRQAPVLFEATLASGLISSFVSAISGGNLYRKSSFLLDALGTQIFAPFITIRELPHLAMGLASSPFDNEGVATSDRDLVKDGILNGYMLSSYSARKLGMQTTGNAGGNHNLLLECGNLDFAGLLKQMDAGLVVTELLGHGINMVTGDYSRGAAGFWVEKGEICYPVEEITIAGNLRDMFRQIIAVGNDVLVQNSRQCGSILIERMTIAGE